MDDGCFAGWRVVAGVEGVFLTGRVAGVGKSDDVEIASRTGLVPRPAISSLMNLCWHPHITPTANHG